MMSWGLVLGGVVCLMFLKWALKNFNCWYHEKNLGKVKFNLPPGDLGWPFIGNMWSFLKAFKSSAPDSFVASFVQRFGNTGLYKAYMFGSPSIIVTSWEACRKVLTDDDAFKPGWPKSTVNLIGKDSFVGKYDEEHRWLRKLTAAPVNGHEALSKYISYIDDMVVKALEEWTSMGEIEFLTELRRLTFRIIMYIFLSSESEHILTFMEKEYTALNYGVRAMAINIPGFAYHSALKARKNLVASLQRVLHDRREHRGGRGSPEVKRDMMDALIDAQDENGRKLSDEEIIDTLVMYLNAGHESSGHITMWATIFLQNHPDVFRRAKAEQEEIAKNMPPDQKELTLKEIRQMEYLSKVIDETMRVITFSSMVFRETKKDVHVCGYTIPRGWKVLVWFRGVHLDPETYPKPKTFDPSRWDGFTPRAGQFLPFGAGSRLCPGNDLAKIEISIFLHRFLLNYQFHQRDPSSPLMYLPHTRPKDNCRGTVAKSVP